MKQYTTPEQTAKLIELGFMEPIGSWETSDNVYSIGELLSFLPENIAKENEMPSTLNISLLDSEWCVEYADFLGADFLFRNVELIDAIFAMLTKLKAEGVI